MYEGAIPRHYKPNEIRTEDMRMASQDHVIAKVGKVTLYRRGGDTIHLKWYDSGKGNWRRRSTQTGDLRRALDMAADLGDAFEAGVGRPETVALGPTILEAFLSHPATKHEMKRYPGDHRRHEAAVKDFCRFGRSDLLRDLAIDRVTDWAADLAKRGFAFDTRRHCLIPLRRASAMAPGFGFSDVLDNMRLDRHTEAIEVRAPELEQVRHLISWARRNEETRWAVAVGLLAFMGLRPSEAIRLKVQDYKDGLLRVGFSAAKNETSRRVLPVPKIVADLLEPLTESRDADESLLGMTGTSENSALSAFSRSIGAVLDRAGLNEFPCKSLRKAFASICLNELGLAPELVEGWLGHKHPGALAVTRRHYLKRIDADNLRPLAKAIDDAMTER